MGRGRSVTGNKRGRPAKTQAYSEQYERMPYGTLWRGQATEEEKKKKNEIINSFLSNARVGNVYSLGGGFGSTGETFEIVENRKSPNKMGIKSGNRNSVILSRDNVFKFLKNGAVLVSKK